jgi:ABC-type long-subunit fatty acid transport system fused permease/ATPase subunit
MSRISSGQDRIVVRPVNNIYTALVAVAVVAELVALIVLWMVSMKLHGAGPFPFGA